MFLINRENAKETFVLLLERSGEVGNKFGAAVDAGFRVQSSACFNYKVLCVFTYCDAKAE